MLLALSMAVDARVPELEGWVQWLTSGAPSEIRNLEVKYEAIYRGHSILLLVSMPVTAWTRLPPSSGFRFVDFVTSENLIPEMIAKDSISDTMVDVSIDPTPTLARLIESFAGFQDQLLTNDDDLDQK